MGKVLAVGNDDDLLYTRRLVLEHAGASVEIAKPKQAIALLGEASFDLLVLCHTLTFKERRNLIQAALAADESPEVHVLLLAASESSPFDGNLGERFNILEGPACLVRRVRDMLVNRQLLEMRSGRRVSMRKLPTDSSQRLALVSRRAQAGPLRLAPRRALRTLSTAEGAAD